MPPVMAAAANGDSAVGGLVWNLRDVSEEAQLAERLRHQAYHDHLTGLANRAMVLEALQGELAGVDESRPVAVCLVDLDKLKEANDRVSRNENPGDPTDASQLTGSDRPEAGGENRPGAEGMIGTDIVAKANPDGYTYLNTSFGFAVNPAIMKKMPFDVEKDFIPVTNAALGTGYLMVINPSVAAKSVKELIDLAKAQPGKINFGSRNSDDQEATHASGRRPLARGKPVRVRTRA